MSYSKSLLADIEPGMDVYDAQDHKVGTVDFAFHGDGEYTAESNLSLDRHDVNNDDVRNAVAGEHLPVAVRERLLGYGFIKIKANGLFASPRLVLPDQVAEVFPEDNCLYLSAAQDALLKG